MFPNEKCFQMKNVSKLTIIDLLDPRDLESSKASKFREENCPKNSCDSKILLESYLGYLQSDHLNLIPFKTGLRIGLL